MMKPSCVWPEGCERKPKARGLCHRHWKTADYRGILDQFSRVRQPSVYNDNGRVCTKCREFKPWGAFAETSVVGVNGRRAHCRSCYNDTRRVHTLRESYGLTVAEFDQMVAAQGGRCAICRTSEPRGKGQWHVDHDHVTGAVRGLLCTDCNTGIGSLKDDPDILQAAVDYLRRDSRPV